MFKKSLVNLFPAHCRWCCGYQAIVPGMLDLCFFSLTREAWRWKKANLGSAAKAERHLLPK
jgi:hypothetical protein